MIVVDDPNAPGTAAVQPPGRYGARIKALFRGWRDDYRIGRTILILETKDDFELFDLGISRDQIKDAARRGRRD